MVAAFQGRGMFDVRRVQCGLMFLDGPELSNNVAVND